jgi:hypothetical protein
MGTLNLPVCVPPLHQTNTKWCRIINLLSIAVPLGVWLRAD